MLAGCGVAPARRVGDTHAPREGRSDRDRAWRDDERAPETPREEAPDEAPAVESPPAPPAPPVLDLPPRPEGAETGSAFLERVEGLGRAALDDAVEAAILAGNIPPYLRRMAPLVVEEGGIRAELHVACDYLAIGDDQDFVRMPMTSAAAQRLANRLGASLPTSKLVDAIWRTATLRLPPCWIDGGPTEGTLADYALHHEKLEERRARSPEPLGVLTAGHKKDIVLSQRMEEDEQRVVIYGWFKPTGDVVQPLSTAHSCRYADYSHGVRLVDQRVVIDGVTHRFSDILRDPELSVLVSAEGPLPHVAYPTELPPYEGRSPRKKKKRG